MRSMSLKEYEEQEKEKSRKRGRLKDTCKMPKGKRFPKARHREARPEGYER